MSMLTIVINNVYTACTRTQYNIIHKMNVFINLAKTHINIYIYIDSNVDTFV